MKKELQKEWDEFIHKLAQNIPVSLPGQWQEHAKTWLYDPEKVADATPTELALYDEVLGVLESLDHTLEPVQMKAARSSIKCWKVLHENNNDVCNEIISTCLNYSRIFYAEDRGDILLHPEQKDASLDQRAVGFYLTLQSAWQVVKDLPTREKLRFFSEAFGFAPCLEAKSKTLDDWFQKNKSRLVSCTTVDLIKQRKADENIGAIVQEILADFKETSPKGKYLRNIEILRQEREHALKEAKTENEKSLRQFEVNLYKQTSESAQSEYDKDVAKVLPQLRQQVIQRLANKEASDGLITIAQINTYLDNTMGWEEEQSNQKDREMVGTTLDQIDIYFNNTTE